MTLVLHQARYDLLALLRDRQARYATLILPLLLAVVLVSLFGENRIGPRHAEAATYYLPGLAALAVIASSFANLVISVVVQRETGVLKRRRATPVPAFVLVAGRALTAVAVSLTTTAGLVIVGEVGFGVDVAAGAVPALVATALAGAAAFCVLGYGLATAIRSADSAQPAIQALLLPLYLGSGIFIPAANLPDAVRRIAELFPVERLADAFHSAYGGALAGGDLAVLGLWAAGGLAVALSRFRWTPSAISRA